MKARYWRGWTAAWSHKPDAAIADLNWIIDHHPEHTAALSARGRMLANLGQFDQALADFDRVMGRPGTEPLAVFLSQGVCYAAKGQHDRAIAEFDKAIDRSPRVGSRVYLERAKSYRATGDMEKALEDLDRAVSLNRRDVAPHMLRAELFMEMGDYRGAAWEADELQRLRPDDPRIWFLRSVAGWLDALDSDHGLAEDTAWLHQIFPASPLPGLIRAVGAEMTGWNRFGALADIDRCLALEPDASFASACRAIFHAHAGHFLPTCRDLALFALKFDRKQYHALVRIDQVNRRLTIGFYLTGPDRKALVQEKGLAAEIGDRYLSVAFQRLVAATLGPEQ